MASALQAAPLVKRHAPAKPSAIPLLPKSQRLTLCRVQLHKLALAYARVDLGKRGVTVGWNRIFENLAKLKISPPVRWLPGSDCDVLVAMLWFLHR